MSSFKYRIFSILIFKILVITNIASQDVSNISEATNLLDYKNDGLTIGTSNYFFPEENKTVYNKNITFLWPKSTSKSSQRLQISVDKNFSTLVLDTIVYFNSCLVKSLNKRKTYFWRVFSGQLLQEDLRPCTFFKTTSFLIDTNETVGNIKFIPTWVEDKEVLYIDNPDQEHYSLLIWDHNKELKLNKSGQLEKFAFETESWPSGVYTFVLSLSDKRTITKSFKKG